MGHANTQMTLTRYSAWIDQADKSNEVSKLDAYLNESGENFSVVK